MTRLPAHALHRLLVSLALMLMGAVTAPPAAIAQPTLADTVLGSTGEIDPGGPVTVFAVRVLIINANEEFALLSYTQRTDNGPTLTKLGWIFLSNDRMINYKMGMITLLRDAMDDPTRSIGIQLVPGTENTARPVVSSVAIAPKVN